MKLPYALVLLCCAAVVVAQDPASKPASRANPPAAPAESFPFYARVVRSDVNVRGGPSDAYSPVARLKAGAVVRIVGRAGDWYKAEVPGGLALWTAVQGGGKPFVKEEAPGVGVVLARDLQIRGTPSTDEPPLGEFNPGDRLEIVGTKGDWANVLMPTKHAGYLAARMTKAAPDGKAAAAEFADQDDKERAARRSQSAALTSTLQKRDAEAARRKRAELASERYLSERRKPAAERDVKGAREALEAVVKEAPSADDPQAVRAKTMLEDLQAAQALEEQLAKARAAQAEAEKRAKESQLTYDRDIEELKRRKAEEAAQRERREKKYVALGFVRLAPPIPGALDKAPKYAIHRGSQREYYLVSDKYDLGDFNGKHVGVLEADAPEDRPGVPLKVLKVRKLEIIAPDPE